MSCGGLMVTIPAKIHAIWLGGILGEKGKNNLVAWKKAHNDFQVTLWLDSALYTHAIKLNEFNELKKWAKDNKIILCDIASDKNDANVQAKGYIYKNMLSKQYYNDEINGSYRNLAAASDILRAEILYQKGGVYIDAEDVFPGAVKLSKILKKAAYGFYCHIEKGNLEKSDSVNNDIIVSVPHGTIISAYRNKINNNYIQLYQNVKKLQAHRNAEFSNQHLYGGVDARKQSTLQTSGPAALDYTITSLSMTGQFISEVNKKLSNENEDELTLHKHFFSLPEKQASSWFDPNAENKYEKVIPVFRSYIREYFNNEINKKINELQPNLIAIDEIKLLKQFQQSFNALSPSTSLMDIQRMMSKMFDSVQKNKLGAILVKFSNCSSSLEEMVHYCQQSNIKANVLSNLLLEMGGKTPNAVNKLNILVNNVLNTKDGKPNLAELKKFSEEFDQLRDKSEVDIFVRRVPGKP